MSASPLAVAGLLIIGFASGALPFSVWLGRRALGADIRAVGDGNPGATNVLRAGGWGWFALAALLDGLKGAVPVGLARFGLGWHGAALTAVALAPIAGHAFSPLLHFRGGKAVAVTFGIWTGLTVWEGPTFFGVFLGIWAGILSNAGWSVLLALASLLAYLLLSPASLTLLGFRPAPGEILAVGAGNAALLAWKHRADLRRAPELRAWLRRRRPGAGRDESDP